MHALVIDDDPSIAQLNRRLLEHEGLVVDIALSAAEGARMARAKAYDLIMLDMVLPDGDGMSVLATIRERHKMSPPVLIVSGERDVETTANALDAGADDYLQKPYRAEELSARVRVLLRRGVPMESARIECGNLILDRTERWASVADVKLSLTVKEFALLEQFVLHRGMTLSRTDLLEKVWRFNFDPGTNLVDVNISRLRAKLADVGANCRIEAQRGVGYVFNEGVALSSTPSRAET